MSELQSKIARQIQIHGAAHVARVLDVSRAAVLSFVAGGARSATRIVIEQRADRLEAQR